MSFASTCRTDRSTRAAIRRTFDQFHSVHEAEYGHFFAESPIEIVNVRLTGVAPTPTIRRVSVKEGGSLGEALLKKAERSSGAPGGWNGWRRRSIGANCCQSGSRVEGPAIILQTDSTTVVPPGWHDRC